MCPHIPNPENGRIEFDGDDIAPFELDTKAVYMCELGFELEGDYSVRTCVMDEPGPIAVWNASSPICVGRSLKHYLMYGKIF